MARFDFKRFSIDDAGCGMKVGTDSVLLGAWTDVTDSSNVIDVGSGSGLLSLMIAQRSETSRITAIEIDAAAAEASYANFAATPWAQRLRVVNSDASSFIPNTSPDLIVCNPPYFSNGIISPDAQRAKARHTRTMLSPVTAVELAAQWLADGGSLAMVTPYEYLDTVTCNAEMLKLKIWRLTKVSTVCGKCPSRLLWQIAKGGHHRLQMSELSIRQDGGAEYTPQYISLTKDFYLHL